MGYQESLIKINDSNIFNTLVVYLDDHKENLKELINIATVVTFKENAISSNGSSFSEGEKCICITGERCGQNKGYIFKELQVLAENTSIIQIEEFTHDKLEKMFSTHEIASEVSFEEYVQDNINEV